jgi:hypothetical protein
MTFTPSLVLKNDELRQAFAAIEALFDSASALPARFQDLLYRALADLPSRETVLTDAVADIAVPLVLRDLVVAVGAEAAAPLVEFVVGGGRALSYYAEGDGYAFTTFEVESLPTALAAHLAAAKSVGVPGGHEWAATLADALGVPAAEVPPADARFALRLSLADGTTRTATVTRHGTAFAWAETEPSRLAYLPSVEDLAGMVAEFALIPAGAAI